MAEESRFLFVYGTLRRGSGHPMHDRLTRHAVFVGPASTAGRLYDTGRYPAAVGAEREDDRIHGELYELDDPDAVWPWLDEYEGYFPGDLADSLFIRRLALVDVEGREALHAWLYWYNGSVDSFERIANSEWSDF